MSEPEYRVTFQPQGRSVFVLAGTTILEAAARAGLIIDTPCGGAGTCGKCRVQVLEGAPEASASDRDVFSSHELDSGWRLACQTPIHHTLVVSVPQQALLGAEHQIVTTANVSEASNLMPWIRKIYVELPPPTLHDDLPDLLRIERAVGPLHAGLPMLRHLPQCLRAQQFTGTAVLADHELIGFEEGDTTEQCYGIACDIGTTTLVGSLVNLCTGEEVALVSRMNPQVSYGDDVLSRIQHASDCPHCLDELRTAVTEELGQMVQILCDQAMISHEWIYEVACAGNTTMQHLLCGINPAQLGEVPFVSVLGHGVHLTAKALDLPVNPHGRAYVFPVIGGFVGGDTVAGMLATDIECVDGPTLMIDIGTNGEIVLAHDGQLYAASTAAGPAFEGARITCGMRGTQGAIEKVVVDSDLHFGVIGHTIPVGICGSGLIDLVAELLNLGVITPEGRLLGPDELPSGLSDEIRCRVCVDDDLVSVLLRSDSGSDSFSTPVVLTQRDVREVQLATGAIRAGILLLLQRAGLQVTDLRSVLIAGGFGMFIRREHAQRIGLLPPDIDPHRIHYVGNVSLAGARRALVSTRARQQGEALARRAQHVELSTDANFQMQFAESMIFPDAPYLTV